MLFIESQVSSRQSVSNSLFLSVYPWSLVVFVPKFVPYLLNIFICHCPWYSAWPCLPLLLSYVFTLCRSFPNLILYSNNAQIGKSKLFGLSIFYIKFFLSILLSQLPLSLHMCWHFCLQMTHPVWSITRNAWSKNVNAVHCLSLRNLKSLLFLELILSTSLHYVCSSHPAS